MEMFLYSWPWRNINSIGCFVFSAPRIASRKTCGEYAFPFTEMICMSGVTPALKAGLFHQTLPSAPGWALPGSGAPRRGLPTEKPREVEKSACPDSDSAFDIQSGVASV